jgi:hypothetical protein
MPGGWILQVRQSTIDAVKLLRALRFLAQQSTNISWSRKNNLSFKLYGDQLGDAVAILIAAAKAWNLPQLVHVAREAEAAHNVFCVGGLSIHSPEAVRYQRAINSVRDFLADNLTDKNLIAETSVISLADFGNLENRMPSVVDDVSEAVRCLELDCNTSSVFHLMRALEAALRIVAKRLKVAIDPSKENWYQIVQHVNKAVDALPSKTRAQAARKQAYGALSAHLNAVRISWRNEVMHPKASYTASEAADIMLHSKVLLKHIAQLV